MKLESEVLVIGAGTSGAVCAVCAARLGLKTILAERTGLVGGVAITALMGSFANLMVASDGAPLLGGILHELLERLTRNGGTPYGTAEEAIHGKIGAPFTIPFQPEVYTEVLTDMLLEAGVTLLLNTAFFGVSGEGSERRVHLAACGERLDAKAVVLVDATGDAQVASACGAPLADAGQTWGCLMRLMQADFGRTLDYVFDTRPWLPDRTFEPWLRRRLGLTDGQEVTAGKILLDPVTYDHAPMQTPSDKYLSDEKLAYIKSRWKTEKVVYTLELSLLRHLIRKAADAGDFIIDQKWNDFQGATLNGDGLACGGWGDGIVLCNVAKPYGFRSSNVRDETNASIAARSYNRMTYRFLKKYVPGFENCRLLDTGSQTVCRAGRMIKGCDQIPGGSPLYHQTIYLFGGIHPFQKGEPVPYGKILPQNCGNLFVVGKGSSNGQRYRSQLSCMSMGIAAAAAAKVVFETGADSHHIPKTALERQLLSMGVLLNREIGNE